MLTAQTSNEVHTPLQKSKRRSAGEKTARNRVARNSRMWDWYNDCICSFDICVVSCVALDKKSRLHLNVASLLAEDGGTSWRFLLRTCWLLPSTLNEDRQQTTHSMLRRFFLFDVHVTLVMLYFLHQHSVEIHLDTQTREATDVFNYLAGAKTRLGTCTAQGQAAYMLQPLISLTAHRCFEWRVGGSASHINIYIYIYLCVYTHRYIHVYIVYININKYLYILS